MFYNHWQVTCKMFILKGSKDLVNIRLYLTLFCNELSIPYHSSEPVQSCDFTEFYHTLGVTFYMLLE